MNILGQWYVLGTKKGSEVKLFALSELPHVSAYVRISISYMISTNMSKHNKRCTYVYIYMCVYILDSLITTLRKTTIRKEELKRHSGVSHYYYIYTYVWSQNFIYICILDHPAGSPGSLSDDPSRLHGLAGATKRPGLPGVRNPWMVWENHGKPWENHRKP